MRAVDTNIVVRFLTGDDPTQAGRARAVIGHEPIFVSRTVLLEAEWVLRSVYALPPDHVIAALRAFSGLPGVSVESAVLVAQAMDWAEAGMDFADALHLSAVGGCTAFLSFDRRLAQVGAAVTGILISEP